AEVYVWKFRVMSVEMRVEEDVVLAVEIADLLGAEIATAVVDSVISRENEKKRKAATNKIVLYTTRPSVDQNASPFFVYEYVKYRRYTAFKFRSRMASYTTTAAETETFKDPMLPCIGILAKCSAVRSRSSD